jgi:hypothetical protein
MKRSLFYFVTFLYLFLQNMTLFVLLNLEKLISYDQPIIKSLIIWVLFFLLLLALPIAAYTPYRASFCWPTGCSHSFVWAEAAVGGATILSRDQVTLLSPFGSSKVRGARGNGPIANSNGFSPHMACRFSPFSVTGNFPPHC